MNLSIAVLLPAKTFSSLSFNWRVNTTTPDGTEIMWKIPYHIDYRNGVGFQEDSSYYDSWDVDSTKSNSIAVEHANGTNSLDEEICLPAGRYSFGYSGLAAYKVNEYNFLPYSENDWGVRRTMFVLLSGDEQIIACGDMFLDGVVGSPDPTSPSHVNFDGVVP